MNKNKRIKQIKKMFENKRIRFVKNDTLISEVKAIDKKDNSMNHIFMFEN